MERTIKVHFFAGESNEVTWQIGSDVEEIIVLEMMLGGG